MGCSSVVTLYFAKKCLTKIDGCAGALSWNRNQLLNSHFPGRFLLTASLRRRRMSMYISVIIVAVTVNYASEFRERFEATTISLQSVHTSSGAQSASNFTGSRRCLPEGHSGRDVKLTNHLQVPEVKNNYICTSTHSSVCMTRRWTILLFIYILLNSSVNSSLHDIEWFGLWWKNEGKYV